MYSTLLLPVRGLAASVQHWPQRARTAAGREGTANRRYWCSFACRVDQPILGFTRESCHRRHSQGAVPASLRNLAGTNRVPVYDELELKNRYIKLLGAEKQLQIWEQATNGTPFSAFIRKGKRCSLTRTPC